MDITYNTNEWRRNSKPLSESVSGVPINLSGDDFASRVLIHEATTSTTEYDEVWLYANNIGTATATLTIQFGDSDDNASKLIQGIPYKQGLVYVLDGFVYNNGVKIYGYGDPANEINVYGWVNTIQI